MRDGGVLRACLFMVLCVAGSVLPACRVASPGAERFPELVEFEGREIDRVVFVAPEPFDADTLALIIETEPTHHRFLGLPIRIPGTRIGLQRRFLDLGVLLRDVERLGTFYHRSGYLGTTVRPVVEPLPGETVRVRFVILREPPVIVEGVELAGTERILDPDSMVRHLPLQRGELLNLVDLAASADTVRRALLARGHAFAEVLREYDADRETSRANVRIVAIPGPVVVVDSIIVEGQRTLERRTVLRQLTFGTGDLLEARRLVASQRNLYGLEIVQVASVALASPDRQVVPEDSARATVLVSVSEGPVHVVEAAAGFGTVDCLRTEARWVNRNFQGGARRLELLGGLSRIGQASPTDVGLGGICRSFRDDDFADRLDYRLRATLTQPWFIVPRNHLTAMVFAERETEPRIFQREAFGGRLAFTHQLAPREVITGTLDAERGRTLADPAIFCAAFLVCLPQDIAAVARPRWRNVLGTNYMRDRRDDPIRPRAGYHFRTSAGWAAPWLGSDVRYLRWSAEASGYRLVRADWVAAGHARLGSFFGTADLDPNDDFLPPEDRFFAGGANSVRGFARNTLGPGVYVGASPVFDPDAARFVPIGGTAVAVVSGELRFRMPWLRRFLGTAVFLDAGAVGDELWRLGPDQWRVTPGFGGRFDTPVGPFRIDIGYNPYPPRAAPLFLPDPETGALIRVDDAFQPDPPGFLRRFRIHVAVGQPY